MEFSSKIDRRIESGVQIAEVFNSENNEQPDYVVFGFDFNDSTAGGCIENLTKLYRNDGTCIAGCIKNCTSDEKLKNFFDVVRFSAAPDDFERLVNFFASLKDAVVSLDQEDFKADAAYEISDIISAENSSQEKISDQIHTECQGVISRSSEQKFSRAYISFFSGDFSMVSIQKISDSVKTCLSENSGMLINYGQNISDGTYGLIVLICK